MRVLLLLTDLYANGGIQRFNRTFLAACVRMDVRCDVLSLHDTEASIGRHAADPKVCVRGFGGHRLAFIAAAFATLWRRRYDRIFIGHINLLVPILAIARLGLATWTPTYLVAHGIEVWCGISPARQRALRRITRVLCVSHYTRTRLQELVPGLDPARLRIFPNALSEIWRCQPDGDGQSIVPERYILSVTRLHRGDRYKGLVTVIEALSMVADTDLHHVVVGHGNDAAFLQGVAFRLGIAHRIHFLNRVSDDELMDLYARCMAFVLPSGKEGFGIVFLEAMYFGAPVIAAAEKGALDVVRHEETGLLVRFGDVPALCAAIERIIADPALRERLRRGGKAAVTDAGAFTFERFVERSREMFLAAPESNA